MAQNELAGVKALPELCDFEDVCSLMVSEARKGCDKQEEKILATARDRPAPSLSILQKLDKLSRDDLLETRLASEQRALEDACDRLKNTIDRVKKKVIAARELEISAMTTELDHLDLAEIGTQRKPGKARQKASKDGVRGSSKQNVREDKSGGVKPVGVDKARGTKKGTGKDKDIRQSAHHEATREEESLFVTPESNSSSSKVQAAGGKGNGKYSKKRKTTHMVDLTSDDEVTFVAQEQNTPTRGQSASRKPAVPELGEAAAALSSSTLTNSELHASAMNQAWLNINAQFPFQHLGIVLLGELPEGLAFAGIDLSTLHKCAFIPVFQLPVPQVDSPEFKDLRDQVHEYYEHMGVGIAMTDCGTFIFPKQLPCLKKQYDDIYDSFLARYGKKHKCLGHVIELQECYGTFDMSAYL